MGYIPDDTINAFKGSFNLGLFFRLGTTPALHMWWGVTDITARIPDLDVAGTKYLGAGMMTDIPDAMEMLINGTSDRVDWQMSGLDPALTANLQSTAPSVVGALASFGVAPMNERWQMVGDIITLWNGVADFWAEEQPIQTDMTKSKTRKITLSTMTGDTTRNIPSLVAWVDQQQKLISPTDRFCERVSRYYQGLLVTWPRF